jgi:GNAT superfamily N-acetyltransferase
MTDFSPDVLALAENLNMHIPRRPGEECFVNARYAAIVGLDADPHTNVVQRLRLQPDEVAATVAEVRALFTARDRRRITWEVGDSATPSDLAERLMAQGMVPDAPESLAVGMVLGHPLESPPGEVVVRPVLTLEEFGIASRILRIGFGGPGEEDPTELEKTFVRHRETNGPERYLAWINGEPVAASDAIYLPAGVVMCGAATLPEARGKGAYRALIAARWEEGRRRGTKTLITQAGAMSRPILARLGFEEVVSVRIFLDVFE